MGRVCGMVRGDRPAVASLRFGGQFVVWAIRLWLAERAGRPGAGQLLDEGLALADLAAARPRLDATLACLAVTAARPVQLNPLCDPSVSDDEILLLRVLAALQIGAGDTAHHLLEGVLPAAGLRTLLGTAKALADALSLAGLHLWSDPSGCIAALRDPIALRPGQAPGRARLH